MTESSSIEQAGEDDTADRLARIWERLLGIESVGSDENYFDLGGDSSLIIHLLAQIEKDFKVKLPVATIFEAPTVGELARILRARAQDSTRP
jgi:acyl carrier protein